MARDILIRLNKLSANGKISAESTVTFQPTVLRTDADGMILPVAFDVELVDGEGTAAGVPESDLNWAYWVQINNGRRGRWSWYVAVPEGTGVINFEDLPRIDPKTLTPINDPDPAWVAAVTDVFATTMDAEIDARVPVKMVEGISTPGPVQTALNAQTAEVVTERVAASPTAVSAVQPFLSAIKRGARDITLLVVSDSTGAGLTAEAFPEQWPYRLAMWLSAQYPTHTVKVRKWDNVSLDYATATTLSTGSGARTITVYVLAVPGWTTVAPLTAPFVNGVKKVQPDLTLVSMGHNEATVTVLETGVPNVAISRYLSLCESITATCPQTAMVVIAQNPSRLNANQALRTDAYQQIASLRGYGFIDVHQHYIDAGTPAAWYLDMVHPTALGAQVWADVVAANFVETPNAQPLVRPVSSLLEPSENLLKNGNFDALTGSTIDHWVANNVTVTFDNTPGNFEAKWYSIKLQPSGAASGSLSQALPNAITTALRGQWVTLAARVLIPSAVQGAGRITLSGAGSGMNSDLTTVQCVGGFHWIVLTKWVPYNATQLVVYLFGESGTTQTGVANYDRVTLVRGMFPRDLANPFMVVP